VDRGVIKVRFCKRSGIGYSLVDDLRARSSAHDKIGSPKLGESFSLILLGTINVNVRAELGGELLLGIRRREGYHLVPRFVSKLQCQMPTNMYISLVS